MVTLASAAYSDGAWRAPATALLSPLLALAILPVCLTSAHIIGLRAAEWHTMLPEQQHFQAYCLSSPTIQLSPHYTKHSRSSHELTDIIRCKHRRENRLHGDPTRVLRR